MEEELSRAPETLLKMHSVSFLLGGKNNPLNIPNDARLLSLMIWG